MARPDQFAGRVELTDAEFADKLKRDEATRKRSDDRCGAFCDDNAWLKKSFNQTSLIVDGDGKMPPLTRAGRDAAGLSRSRHLRRRAVREPARLHQLRSLHHPRRGRLGAPGRLRQRQPDPADPERGGDQLRDGARHARHPARRPAPHRLEDPPVHGRRARSLGRQHPRRRNHQPDRPDQHRPERQRLAPQRRHEDRRAVHPQGAGRAAVRDPHRRSDHLHAAVHDEGAADFAARVPVAALRLPRRQLHAAQRAARRARRGQGARGRREEGHHQGEEGRAVQRAGGAAEGTAAGENGPPPAR